MSYECSYVELPTPSTIRLIELQEGRVNDTFICAIYHVDCTQSQWTHLEYNALSYVWGDSKPTRQIHLIDSTDEMYPVSIHENLWRFLAWAWDKGLHKGSYTWTDRICLDQNNEKEMAQQVPRMGEIFRNATRVFSWLGMSEQQGQHLKPFLDLYRDGKDPREHLYAPETPLAVATIANNEYWTRVWILQEFALAKQVVVVVGNVETTVEELDVIKFCFRELGSASWKQMKRVLDLRRSEGGLQQLWKMLPIMVSSDYLGCTFQSKRLHDRVYGVLGLLANHLDGTSPIDYIDVDYSKPIGEVILDALLESRVPTTEEHFLTYTAGVLLEQGNIMIQEPLYELFKKYLRSNRTSERHKTLARLVMQFYDALNSLLWLMTSNANSSRLEKQQLPTLRSMRGLFGRILRSFNPVLMPTPQQSAIMIGLLLVSEINCQQPKTSDSIGVE